MSPAARSVLCNKVENKKKIAKKKYHDLLIITIYLLPQFKSDLVVDLTKTYLTKKSKNMFENICAKLLKSDRIGYFFIETMSN